MALAAGVSQQTVSRVVRGTPNVAAATRARVLTAIDALGYRPNLAARSLSAGRVGAVHVVVATPLFHGIAALFVSLCKALSSTGLATSMSTQHGGHDVSHQIPVSADGVIVIGGFPETELWLADVATRVPVVYVGWADELPIGVSAVMVDMVAGAELAVKRLVDSGWRRLAHIAGPENWNDARLRIRGFEKAVAELGVDGEIVRAGSWDGKDAKRVAGQLTRGVEATFASNDELALGCLAYCHEAGVRVPEQMAVVGFDNTPGSDAFWPPLTTIDQRFLDQGNAAASEIVRLIKGERSRKTVLQPELIVRRSA